MDERGRDEIDYGTPVVRVGSVAVYRDINMPPIRWTIDHLLKDRGIGLLYGSSGTMKTYSTIDLACRMVNGMDFHRRKLTQGDVIYVVGEAEDEVKERIDGWLSYHNKSERPLIVPWAVSINRKAEIDDLAEVVNKFNERVKLVVFDTLSDCSAGVKLSDPDEVNASIKPSLLTFVRRTKASTLLVHHTGHNESHERGARVLRDMTDTTIKVTKANSTVTLKVEKLRRAESGDQLRFTVKDISEITSIDNAAILLPHEEACVSHDEDNDTPRVEAPPKKLCNEDKLVSLVADYPDGIHWKDAARELDWFNEDTNKATSSYYSARDSARDGGHIELRDGLLILGS